MRKYLLLHYQPLFSLNDKDIINVDQLLLTSSPSLAITLVPFCWESVNTGVGPWELNQVRPAVRIMSQSLISP